MPHPSSTIMEAGERMECVHSGFGGLLFVGGVWEIHSAKAGVIFQRTVRGSVPGGFVSL